MLHFPESPMANARMCLKLAPRHCTACHGFHLSAIMRRATLPIDQRIGDFAEFQAATSQVLAQARSTSNPVRVIIGGTTDTGLYAGLLNAAVTVGGPGFARSLDVTIIDQCQTPLEICKSYAQKNDLQPTTIHADMAEFQPDTPAGLILVHGVLSFIPLTKRLPFLKHLRNWLLPGGRLISSTQMGHKQGKTEREARVDQALQNLKTVLTDSTDMENTETDVLERQLKEGMLARNQHADLFNTEEDAIGFYESAELSVESFTCINTAKRAVNGLERRYSQRGLAVCRRA